MYKYWIVRPQSQAGRIDRVKKHSSLEKAKEAASEKAARNKKNYVVFEAVEWCRPKLAPTEWKTFNDRLYIPDKDKEEKE